MAELRIINKDYNIENFYNLLGPLLSLPNEYGIIPCPLGSLGLRVVDSIICVFGLSDLFLISSHLLPQTPVNTPSKEPMGQLEITPYEARKYLKEYAQELSDLFIDQHIIFPIPMHLFLLTPEGAEAQSIYEDIQFVPIQQIRSKILQINSNFQFNDIQKNQVIHVLKANNISPRINQYQILKELNKSEGQTSFIAYNIINNKLIILKEIKTPGTGDISTIIKDKAGIEQNEILREAKLTKELDHENILKVEKIIPSDEKIFIVMEWIQGIQTLKKYFDKMKRRIPLEKAIPIVLEICSGLEYAHSHDIVHRNIRPENIILTPRMKVKITNFEFAKHSKIVTMDSFALKKMLKENPYAAPEFIVGTEGIHDVDQRVDIYAVGAVIYELLTGQVPSHLDERYWIPPSNLCPTIGTKFDAIIAKALRMDPVQRYSTITALKNRLKNIDKPVDLNESEYRYINRTYYTRTLSNIYKALDNKFDRPVILKKVLMDPTLTYKQRKQQLDNLLKEACLVSQLTHPYIVSVYDYFIEDDDGYIVMELVEGETLREYIQEYKILSPEVVCNISKQIGEALKYAHNQGVIHRDIKPENIIYKNGRITILDFGLATEGGQKEIHKTGGTLLYMAPEQLIESIEVDNRADIFSLGVLMYELLTGIIPYPSALILNKYLNSPIPQPISPSELNIAVSSDLSKIILKNIQVNPEDRYQKIEEFLTSMNNLVGKTRSKRKKLPKLIQILVEILVVLVLIVIIIVIGDNSFKGY